MVKRTAKTPLSTGSAEEVARAHARLEALVTSGARDPRSLFLIPTDLVRACKVTFPPHAFGKPEDW